LGATATTIAGLSSLTSANITGSAISSSGALNGNIINAGTNSSDQSFVVQNKAGSGNYLVIRGDGLTIIGNLSGTGNRIVGADASGNLSSITVGAGLSLTAGVLIATGGSSGTVTVTAGALNSQVPYFTSATNIAGSSNHVWDATNNRLGLGTSSMAYARLNVYNNTNDATYGAKIQGVFGPADYQDSDATQNYGAGTSETQFLVGTTGRPAMLSLGGNVNAGEASGVINFFRSTNTDTYRSRAWIWSGINTTGTANQHGGYLAFSTAADSGVNPQERLRIASTGAATFTGSVTAGDIFSTDGTRINFFGVGTGANTGYVGMTTNHPLAFLTNNTEKMRIAITTGNVLIGTTTDATGKLQVSGTVYATAYYETSDIRLKNVIETNPEVNVSGIDVIKFTRTDNDTEQVRYGYSAQQVQTILPDVVTGQEYLNVNYTDIHTLKIAALELEITELKELIKSLIK
jgi:hypothetical protein